MKSIFFFNKVGLKKPNPWGLFDMHGNISEWTLDMHDVRAYQKYSGTLADNPYEKPTKLYPRVVRGGSWMNSDFKLRSASRQVSSKQWKKQDPQIPRSIWWHTDAQFVGFRDGTRRMMLNNKEYFQFGTLDLFGMMILLILNYTKEELPLLPNIHGQETKSLLMILKEPGDLRYDATIMTHYEGIELKFPYFKKLQNLDQVHSLRSSHPENI